MKYKYVLFDLDGTLTDPKEGITKSVQYALDSLGIHEPDLDKLQRFIGPPLLDSFQEYYHLDEETAKIAIDKYRERFVKLGMYENILYTGIKELLSKLKEDNKILVVATSKLELYAVKILQEFGLYEYFDEVVGSELDGTRTKKKDVILESFGRLNLEEANLKETVMIGDRKHDIIGANYCHIDSIGVRYGYSEKDELKIAGATYIVNTIEELGQLLIGI